MKDITINCPFCVERGKGEDTTRNLSIMPEGQVYHCFRCGARPKETGWLPASILAQLPMAVAPYMLRSGIADDRAGIITRSHPILDCDACIEYVRGRGYNAEQLSDESRWLYGGWFMGHRIFFQGQTEHEWQGRAISPRNPVRYMTPPDLGHAMILPFPQTSSLQAEPHVCMGTPVLVEGPFDALRLWTVGIRAICLVGVSYSDSKLALVQKELWNDTRVILCLDKEGTDNEAMKWTWYLSKFIAVKQWDLRAPDPDTMGMVELKELAKEAGA